MNIQQVVDCTHEIMKYYESLDSLILENKCVLFLNYNENNNNENNNKIDELLENYKHIKKYTNIIIDENNLIKSSYDEQYNDLNHFKSKLNKLNIEKDFFYNEYQNYKK